MPLDPHARRFLDIIAMGGVVGGVAEPSVAGRRNSLANLARLSKPRVASPVTSRDLVLPGPGGDLPARLYDPPGAKRLAGQPKPRLPPRPHHEVAARSGALEGGLCSRGWLEGSFEAADAAHQDEVEDEISGLPSRSEERLLAGLVFFHGGGFVAGDLDTHDAICRALSEAGGFKVLAVAYRLAPEHPFPAAVEDALAAFRWAAAQAETLGIDPRRLAVGGDSAGAGLAAMLCQQARAWPDLVIAAQLLLCPVLDAAGTEPSRNDFAQGYFLDAATIARDIAALGLAGCDLADPRISPLHAPDLRGLPPAIIHTAEFDMVRDDGIAYAGRLAQAGVPVRHTCHAGMIHYFYGLGGLVPASGPALQAMGWELAAVLG